MSVTSKNNKLLEAMLNLKADKNKFWEWFKEFHKNKLESPAKISKLYKVINQGCKERPDLLSEEKSFDDFKEMFEHLLNYDKTDLIKIFSEELDFIEIQEINEIKNNEDKFDIKKIKLCKSDKDIINIDKNYFKFKFENNAVIKEKEYFGEIRIKTSLEKFNDNKADLFVIEKSEKKDVIEKSLNNNLNKTKYKGLKTFVDTNIKSLHNKLLEVKNTINIKKWFREIMKLEKFDEENLSVAFNWLSEEGKTDCVGIQGYKNNPENNPEIEYINNTDEQAGNDQIKVYTYYKKFNDDKETFIVIKTKESEKIKKLLEWSIKKPELFSVSELMMKLENNNYLKMKKEVYEKIIRNAKLDLLPDFEKLFFEEDKLCRTRSYAQPEDSKYKFFICAAGRYERKGYVNTELKITKTLFKGVQDSTGNFVFPAVVLTDE